MSKTLAATFDPATIDRTTFDRTTSDRATVNTGIRSAGFPRHACAAVFGLAVLASLASSDAAANHVPASYEHTEYNFTGNVDLGNGFSKYSRNGGNNPTVTSLDTSNTATLSAWYGIDRSSTELFDISENIGRSSGSGIVIDAEHGSYECASTDCQGEADDHHTIDNKDGYEYLAIDFGHAVNLAEVTLGWREKDSDFSILYLNENETFDSFATSTSRAAFTLADNFYGAQSDYSSSTDQVFNKYTNNQLPFTDGNDDLIFSSVWMIAAYNSDLGGSANGADEGSSYWVDGFKLAGLVTKKLISSNGGGNGGDVPVPATAALFGLGALALRARRRRQ